jgi:hypothetical protein
MRGIWHAKNLAIAVAASDSHDREGFSTAWGTKPFGIIEIPSETQC